MKASLFDDDEDEENMDIGNTLASPAVIMTSSKARPVVLEARPTVLKKRDPIVDDIAHSMLTGGQGKGLGGSFILDGSSSAASNLLRSRFGNANNLDKSGSSFLGGGNFGTDSGAGPVSSLNTPSRRRQIPGYNLQVLSLIHI